MKRYLGILLMAGLMPVMVAQEHEERYVPETDPLVLQKLEAVAGSEIRAADALGPLQPVGNCRIMVDLR